MKNKIIKRIFIIFLVVILAALLIVAIMFQKWGVFEFLGMFEPSKADVEKAYSDNKTELEYVSDLLLNDSSHWIQIRSDELTNHEINYKKTYYDENEQTFKDAIIDGKETIDKLDLLRKNGFIPIEKDSNYICFIMWSSFGGRVGLAYSEGEPDVSEIYAIEKNIESLDTKNWYYYRIMQK